MLAHVLLLLLAALGVYMALIVIDAIASFLPEELQGNVFCRFLEAATDPALKPLRRFLPPLWGLDFSPVIALVLLGGLRKLAMLCLAAL